MYLYTLLFHTPFGLGALVFFIALIFALVKPQTARRKLIATSVVVLLAGSPFIYAMVDHYLIEKRVKARYAESERMFRERCQKAGETIKRTEVDVRGVVLLKVRPNSHNFERQYDLTDPYGSDLTGHGYIQSFLKTYNAIATNPPRRLGYDYVDIREGNGVTYRYTGSLSPMASQGRPSYLLERNAVDHPDTKFGVTYDDISSKEDRDHWIAGSSLRVIDLTTGEIIGERVGYMMDPAQGSIATGRAPWHEAADHACPSFGEGRGYAKQITQTVRFVSRVLHPRVEE